MIKKYYHAQKLKKAKTLKEAQSHMDVLNEMRAIPQLIDKGLMHKNKKIAEKAGRALTRIGGSKLMEELGKRIKKHEVSGMTEVCAKFLGHMGTVSAIETLINYGLGHDVAIVNVHMKEALKWNWNKASSLVIQRGLRSEDDMIAYNSAALLGSMKEHQAVDALEEFGLKHKDPDVVGMSAWALGELGDRQVLVSLMKLSGHENEEANKDIKKAIKKIQEIKRVEKNFKYHAKKLREGVEYGDAGPSIYALNEMGSKEAIRTLIKSGVTNTHFVIARTCADKAGEAIKELLKNNENCKEEIDMLAETGLKHKSEYVVRDTALALGSVGDKRAVEPLIEHGLKNDETLGFCAAIRHLGNLGDKRAVDPIIKYGLSSNNWWEVEQSLKALDKLKSDKTLDALINLLDHKNVKVLHKVIESLGMIGDKKSLPYLMKLSGHEDKDINFQVKHVIKRIQVENRAKKR